MQDIYDLMMLNINVFYIFMCNLITYLIIDTFKSNSKSQLSKNFKRLISIVSALFIGFVMIHLEMDSNPNIKNQVFYGFFIQFLSWDYCFKGLLKFIKNKFSDKEENKMEED